MIGLYKKQRQELYIHKEKSDIEDIITASKRDESSTMFLTKTLPNIIDSGAIAASIISLNPIWLSGAGIGELWRFYTSDRYQNEKVRLRKLIKIYERLEKV